MEKEKSKKDNIKMEMKTKKGCGKEIDISKETEGEWSVGWKCGEQFNTNLIPLCPSCSNHSQTRVERDESDRLARKPLLQKSSGTNSQHESCAKCKGIGVYHSPNCMFKGDSLKQPKTDTFNLSEKRKKIKQITIMSLVGSGRSLKFAESICNKVFDSIEQQDKEFIKRLKYWGCMFCGKPVFKRRKYARHINLCDKCHNDVNNNSVGNLEKSLWSKIDKLAGEEFR